MDAVRANAHMACYFVIINYNLKEYSSLSPLIYINPARSLSSVSEHWSMLSAGLFFIGTLMFCLNPEIDTLKSLFL